MCGMHLHENYLGLIAAFATLLKGPVKLRTCAGVPLQVRGAVSRLSYSEYATLPSGLCAGGAD
jgi:hypothetical protein